jgi:hypothetical protein
MSFKLQSNAQSNSQSMENWNVFISFVSVCICLYLFVFVCICLYLFVFVCICLYSLSCWFQRLSTEGTKHMTNRWMKWIKTVNVTVNMVTMSLSLQCCRIRISPAMEKFRWKKVSVASDMMSALIGLDESIKWARNKSNMLTKTRIWNFIFRSHTPYPLSHKRNRPYMFTWTSW